MKNNNIYQNFKFNKSYKKDLLNFLKNNATVENGGNKIFDGTYNDLLHIPEELADLIFYLKKYENKNKTKINSFLEIGFSHGILNTLINKFFSIKDNIAIDCLGPHINGRVLLANMRHKNLILFCSDSTNTETIKKIKKIANFDLIFIDGNHDYEYVKNDFFNCTKLLKKNGLIIFHDINLPNSGSKKFWNEIKKKFKKKQR